MDVSLNGERQTLHEEFVCTYDGQKCLGGGWRNKWVASRRGQEQSMILLEGKDGENLTIRPRCQSLQKSVYSGELQTLLQIERITDGRSHSWASSAGSVAQLYGLKVHSASLDGHSYSFCGGPHPGRWARCY